MLLPFRLGVGGRLGDGKQWMSWIALADYVEAVTFLARHCVDRRPGQSRRAESGDERGVHARARPRAATSGVFHVPRAALKLAMGEMAEATVLASQRVRPRRLLEAGFNFSLPTLEAALRAELTRSARSDDR